MKLEAMAMGCINLNFFRSIIENAGYITNVLEEMETVVGEIETFNYLVSPFLKDNDLWINTHYRLKAKKAGNSFIVYVQYDNVVFNAIQPYNINDLCLRTFLVFDSEVLDINDIISEINLEKFCNLVYKN